MREILVIDDDEGAGMLAVRAFTRAGIPNPVVVINDAVEALRDLLPEEQAQSSRTTTPAMILLDLNMPRINGIEVLRRLRQDERTRAIPVIVLTSSREDKDIRDVYATGANSYIQKPVDFVRFVEAVRVIGAYWLELNVESPAVRPPTVATTK